ncbi:MAG: 23S rRNA (guanosine(2251)-2'-O)-methyltransferase RlmB [Firmicutes bacterium]|nr:23S rRNA (guanosine(2251)-2'-O)-methyltransferase RlmB [Bacillota bacterium]
MAKNKRDWSEINARKGKRYVPRTEEKKARPAGKSAPKAAARDSRRQDERDFDRGQNFDQEPAANVIIGRNPLMEALKNDREIEKILIGKGAEGSVTKIVGMAKDKGIPLYQSDKQTLDRIACGRPHQGVIAYASAYSYSDMEDIYKKAAEKNEEPLVIILDNLEDPHNLGAIMRTAECAGAHGVIIPKRRSCGLTEVVAKSSAGAIEYVPCVKVANIGQTIDQLKEDGFWIAACDMGGNLYYKQDLTGKLAIVIGSEGAGISQLVRKKCDFVVSMPMVGEITSLNASNAAAVLMYEVRRQRDEK